LPPTSLSRLSGDPGTCRSTMTAFHQSEESAVSIRIVPASVLFWRPSSSPRLYHNR
jgi:hypothetical protein